MQMNAVSGIAVSDLRQAYLDRRLSELSDRDLVAAVGEIVAVPRQGEVDSFVLHAPLELMARSRLLPMVSPSSRNLARLHILAIAAQYEAFGPGIEIVDDHPSSSTDLLRDLPSATLSATAAAGHASIYLAFLHELGAEADEFAGLATPLRRELERRPDWRIRWYQDRSVRSEPTDADSLFEALAGSPRLGPPGSTFIHPLMMRVDESGLAAEVLGPRLAQPTRQAAHSVLRVAALSMVYDDTQHAPYGWSHCLTLPQAVLRLGPLVAEPAHALAVAATQVLAFRASLSGSDLADMHLVRPVDSETIGRRATALATAGATAHDAHIAKYSLAAITAVRDDPAAADLYLTAGETLLAAWESAGGDPTDPLL